MYSYKQGKYHLEFWKTVEISVSKIALTQFLAKFSKNMPLFS